MNSGYHISDQHATYFMTFTVVGWVDLFTRKECKDIIINSLKYCQENKGLIIYAFALMESHLHLLASSLESSTGLSAIVRDFKKFTSRELMKWIIDNPQESRRDWLRVVFEYHAKFNQNNKHFQVWQQHNMPKVCVQPKFTLQKLNYIHNNPVVAGIVDNPVDYKYSSARNYADRTDFVLDVNVLDFGVQVGYVGF
ncbi:MAG TPA: transposase [Saprospiraceae bacterium]|nr:transposase [Saprospiraceae bacterium]